MDTTTCLGFTDGELHAGFPSGCGGLFVQDISGGTGSLLVYPWLLEVRNKKNRMTVRINFTEDQNFVLGHPPDSGTNYISDRFIAVINPDASGFTIVVDELNKNLTKTKEPNKGTVVGTVSFGSIVYTPTDSSPF